MALPRFLVENFYDPRQFPGATVSANEEETGHEAFRVGTNRRSSRNYWTPTTANQAAWVKVDLGADAGYGSPVDGAALRLGDDEYPFSGAGEENLIRDAAMDTDTDGDGVVDGWDVTRQDTGWTPTLNGGEGAQEFTADGTGANGDWLVAVQAVLRVFPGDEILFSTDAKLANSPTDIAGSIYLQWWDSGGNFLSNTSPVGFTATSYARRVATGTAPAGCAFVEATIRGIVQSSGGSGDVRFRDARLLRASSDPATYANPHVSGGSQTGSTLATAGWPANEANIARKGDWIRPGGSGATQADAESELGSWMRVAADADADANGDATIELSQSLTGRRADMITVDRNSNIAGETLTLEYSHDDSTWTEAFSVTVPAESVDRTALTEPSGVLTPEGAWLKTFDAAGARYWRVHVAAMGAGERPQIGGIYLGSSWEPTFHMTRPWGWGDRRLEFDTSRSDTAWVSASRPAQRIEADLNFQMASEAEYDDFARYHIEELFLQKVPMWIIFDQAMGTRAWFAMPQSGRAGFQQRSGWGFQQGTIPAAEHEPELI